MATTSTGPTVKARLVTVLTAATTSPVQVFYGHPGDLLESTPKAIYLGNIRGRHEWAVMRAGRKPRDEQYVIDCFIDAFVEGGTEQQAEEAVFVLLTEVEDAIANDPQLGIPTVLQWAKVGEWETTNGFNDQGCGCLLRVEIECEARLT